MSVYQFKEVTNGTILSFTGGVQFTPNNEFIGTGSLTYEVTDGLNTSIGTIYIIITPTISEGQTPLQPDVTVSEDKKDIVIVDVPFDSNITVPGNVKDATLDLSALISQTDATKSATISGQINVNAETTIGNIGLSLPAGLGIDGSTAWDGTINIPTVKDNSTVAFLVNGSPTSVVEVGFGDTKLTLSKAVRIVIPNKKGQLAGSLQAGIFTPINTICTEDTQTANDQLVESGDCKIDVGENLVIWTKHMTQFITYTPATNPTPNNSGSGSTGGSSSGSGVCMDSKPQSSPKIISVKATGKNELTLTWTKAKDPVTYYLIAYGLEKGKMIYGNPNVGNTTSYTIKGLSGNTTYYFKVRAGNNCMSGDFSEEVSAKTTGGKVTKAAKGFVKQVTAPSTPEVTAPEIKSKSSNIFIDVIDSIKDFTNKLFSQFDKYSGIS